MVTLRPVTYAGYWESFPNLKHIFLDAQFTFSSFHSICV